MGVTLPTEHSPTKGWFGPNGKGLLGVGHRVLSKVGRGMGGPSSLERVSLHPGQGINYWPHLHNFISVGTESWRPTAFLRAHEELVTES